MISHIMLTFICDRCGAEKQRPASEDDKTPPLPLHRVPGAGKRFFDHTIDDPEVLSLFRDKEG